VQNLLRLEPQTVAACSITGADHGRESARPARSEATRQIYQSALDAIFYRYAVGVCCRNAYNPTIASVPSASETEVTTPPQVFSLLFNARLRAGLRNALKNALCAKLGRFCSNCWSALELV